MGAQRDRINSFFDLIEVDGKDDVFDEMEEKVEMLVNGAIEFLLDSPVYDLEANHSN